MTFHMRERKKGREKVMPESYSSQRQLPSFLSFVPLAGACLQENTCIPQRFTYFLVGYPGHLKGIKRKSKKMAGSPKRERINDEYKPSEHLVGFIVLSSSLCLRKEPSALVPTLREVRTNNNVGTKAVNDRNQDARNL